MADWRWSAERVLKPSERAAFEQVVLERLRDVYAANPWVVAVEVDQGAVRFAASVREVGGADVLAVGARSGIGPIDDSVPLVSLGLAHEDSMLGNIRVGQQALQAPPPGPQAVVDDWDPGRSARSLGSFTGVSGSLMGRETFGSRPPKWRALEDKLAIEALWAAAEIPVAPSEQVDRADIDGLLAAHDRLATNSGTVWAGDNTSGWHGGGSGTFWVPDRQAAIALAPELTRFERLRIMPFVDGLPCSIHGMVVPDGDGGVHTVVFRPCEMMVLRDPSAHRFVYCRSATFWDPAPQDRAAMRSTARRIGAELVRTLDFRGIYTVDGVMSRDGFVPTEVNTRYGAALPQIHTTLDGASINLVLLSMAVLEGRFDDIDLRPLGPVVTEALDSQRYAVGFLHTSAAPKGGRSAVVSRDITGQLVATDIDPGASSDHRDVDGETDDRVAEVNWGSTTEDAGFAIATFSEVTIGPPTAPLLLEVARVLDDHWSMGLGSLEAAPVLR